MIKVWHSYSCNNSSAYRLVARFADATTAEEVATELQDYFAAQLRQRTPYSRASALAVLAQTYGFDWIDSNLSRKPSVFVEGDVLVVYHPNALGPQAMGPGLPAFLADRGGTSEPESRAAIQLTALIKIDPNVEAQHYDEVIVLFASLVDAGELVLAPPWGDKAAGATVWFRDRGMIGLHFPINPPEIPKFKTWLASFGIDGVLRLEDRGDRELFETLVEARCTACQGSLEYLDPRLHDIEAPQLLCKPCGGLYDLGAFT